MKKGKSYLFYMIILFVLLIPINGFAQKNDDLISVIIEINENYFNEKRIKAEDIKNNQELKNLQIKKSEDILKKSKNLFKEQGLKIYDLKEVHLIMTGFTGKINKNDIEKFKNLEFIKSIDEPIIYNAPSKKLKMELRAATLLGENLVNLNPDIRSTYKGEGRVIAILDSGLDKDHPAMYLTNPQRAVWTSEDQINKEKNKMNLNASMGRWLSPKVPFAYNYFDKDMNIKDENKITDGHGQHVAGIAAGNYVENENGSWCGIAPEAQIFALRVFGNYDTTTSAEYYVPAMDDAIKLGANSINMSLGTPAKEAASIDKPTLDGSMSNIGEAR